MVTKQYPIVSFNNELHMIDNDAPFGDNVYYYDTKQEQVRHGSNNHATGGYKKKIEATTDKSLGLPLLPAMDEEDNNDFISDVWCHIVSDFSHNSFVHAAKAILKANTKKYTEEDIKNAYENGMIDGRALTKTGLDWLQFNNQIESKTQKYLKSLSKVPIAVEVETSSSTFTTHGRGEDMKNVTEWYPKIENGFIKVIRWIY